MLIVLEYKETLSDSTLLSSTKLNVLYLSRTITEVAILFLYESSAPAIKLIVSKRIAFTVTCFASFCCNFLAVEMLNCRIVNHSLKEKIKLTPRFAEESL